MAAPIPWPLEQAYSQGLRLRDFTAAQGDYTTPTVLPNKASDLVGYLHFQDRLRKDKSRDAIDRELKFMYKRDGAWHGHRMLGEGGFGRVGLFRRFDYDGEVAEHIAIKEMDDRPSKECFWPWSNILNEVMVSFQLNKENCENILRLKTFKYYPILNNDKANNIERTRLYMEYAPYGTLEDLRGRYQSRGAYFPELFLWHVFRELITAVKVMKESSFRDPRWEEDENLEAIHLDIKGENILLGDTASESELTAETDYPTLKIADFGASHITCESDSANPDSFSGQGTSAYMVPEHFSRDLDNHVFRQRFQDYNDISFDWRTNVWGVGMIMWELITMQRWPHTENMLRRKDKHAIREINSGRDPEYSHYLRDRVRQCLHTEMDKRHGFDRLEADINHAISLRHTSPSLNFENVKVYYKPEEWNDLPLGRMRIVLDDIHHIEQLRSDEIQRWKEGFSSRFFVPEVALTDTLDQARLFIPDYVQTNMAWFNVGTGHMRLEINRHHLLPNGEIFFADESEALWEGNQGYHTELQKLNEQNSGENFVGLAGHEMEIERWGERNGHRQVFGEDPLPKNDQGHLCDPPQRIVRRVGSVRFPRAHQSYSADFQHGHMILPTRMEEDLPERVEDGPERAENILERVKIILERARHAINQSIRHSPFAATPPTIDQFKGLSDFLLSDYRESEALFFRGIEEVEDGLSPRLLGALFHVWCVRNGCRFRLGVLQPETPQSDYATIPFDGISNGLEDEEDPVVKTLWIAALPNDPEENLGTVNKPPGTGVTPVGGGAASHSISEHESQEEGETLEDEEEQSDSITIKKFYRWAGVRPARAEEQLTHTAIPESDTSQHSNIESSQNSQGTPQDPGAGPEISTGLDPSQQFLDEMLQEALKYEEEMANERREQARRDEEASARRREQAASARRRQQARLAAARRRYPQLQTLHDRLQNAKREFYRRLHAEAEHGSAVEGG